MTVWLLAIAAVVLDGCAPKTSTGPPRWDAYADRGPLPVRGAPPSDPGPTILRALQRQPAVGRIVAARGEPDTLEILTVGGTSRRIILTYGRDQPGRPRRIVLQPPNPEPTPGRSSPATHSATRRARGAASASSDRRQLPTPAGGTPTSLQALECPIDPGRPDCRALCDGSGTHEWCR